MANIQKLVDKMRRQPHGITFEEADKVLNHHGYIHQQQRGSGSHRIYAKEEENPLSLPYKRPNIRSVYVKEILKRIDG